jgi:hypothetical protein
MRYTAKIKQAQLAGKVRIEPKGGELQEAEVKAVMADPWGKELIGKGMLTIDEAKPPTAEAEKKK